MLKVLIASPYPALRLGLRFMLEKASREAVVVGEANTWEQSLDLARTQRAEVVLFDLALEADEEMNGIWELRTQFPALPIIALSETEADPRVLFALQAGARGCLAKTVTSNELADATRRVVMGEPILHPATTAALLDQLRGAGTPEHLTPRECEVLRHVAAGQTNKMISLKLGISEHTVKFHLGGAMSKLGAASRAEAVALAMRRGVITV